MIHTYDTPDRCDILCMIYHILYDIQQRKFDFIDFVSRTDSLVTT